MNYILLDKKRYVKPDKMPKWQKYFRKSQNSKSLFSKLINIPIYRHYCKKNLIEISKNTQIAGGLYVGHPYSITINDHAIIGKNCNLHKNVTIGQENRGIRQGAPTIGDNVWIGINATIVGKITIGNDVLIAPNTFVNCDVPSHSVVFGNPCIIKHKDNATEGYINNAV